MADQTHICPECGFDLHSPVEIKMAKGMMGAEIYDKDDNLIWSGSDTETAYIDAPERTKIRICWRVDAETTRNVKNGEAYRFEQIRGFPIGFVKLIKTRTIPKRKKLENDILEEAEEAIMEAEKLQDTLEE